MVLPRREYEYLRFPVGRDCEAVVQIYGPATQEGIQMLIEVLELSKDAFPKAEELKTEVLNSSRPTTEAIGEVPEYSTSEKEQ